MFDYQCKLLRVVDGDTIDVNIDLGFSVWHKARVRMLGIDTPESRTRNLAEKALGKASGTAPRSTATTSYAWKATPGRISEGRRSRGCSEWRKNGNRTR